jgi:hypothetical protein
MALYSLHGRQIGYDSTTGGFKFGSQGLVRGAIKKTTITSAQLLALNATPQIIVPAPGAGLAVLVNRVMLSKAAGTAYAGIAVGEDLVAKYTNGAGAQVSSVIETTGFLDQATAQSRYVGPPGAVTTAAADVAPVANAAVVMHLLVGEITTGNSDLLVWVDYDIMPTVLDVLSLD